MKLQKEFYLDDNVVKLAQELLGKVLCTRINNEITCGIITETEAYEGETDCASHAWNGRRTERTEVMYLEGGRSYVYLCYGIHHLFNVVTNIHGTPHAILIRAIKPIEGIETILKRRKLDPGKPFNYHHFSGPGKVSQALGIDLKLNNKDLTGNIIWIDDRGIQFSKEQIVASPRIGVDYAGEHAKWHYRFEVKW